MGVVETLPEWTLSSFSVPKPFTKGMGVGGTPCYLKTVVPMNVRFSRY